MSHGTCSYIYRSVHAVAVLYYSFIPYDFYNIDFKIIHKLYIGLGSALKKFLLLKCREILIFLI